MIAQTNATAHVGVALRFLPAPPPPAILLFQWKNKKTNQEKPV